MPNNRGASSICLLWLLVGILSHLSLPVAGRAGTFGTAITIGGHVSDIALDERRGALYIANYTADEICVMSLRDNEIQERIPVLPQPGSLALSPEGRFLVIAHHPVADDPVIPGLRPAHRGLSIFDMHANLWKTIAMDPVPVAVAFGNSPRALVIRTDGFWLLDPFSATMERLQPERISIEGLPVPFATFPPQILKASSTISGDGNAIYALVDPGPAPTGPAPDAVSDPSTPNDDPSASPSGSAGSLIVRYDILSGHLRLVGVLAGPALGPRVISTDLTGSSAIAAWTLISNRNIVLARFPYPLGAYQHGSHAWDYKRGLLYAQLPTGLGATSPNPTPTPLAPQQPNPTQPVGELPVLHIVDADNFTVRERIRLPENLAGKAVLTTDLQTLYAASDSGVVVLPVGDLDRTPRITSSHEDLLLRGSTCDNQMLVGEIDITDRDAGGSDFSIQVLGSTRGIRISASSSTTPARVRIEVDPIAYQNERGTTVVPIQISSEQSVNLPIQVRLLINMKQNARGDIHNVPGRLVDLMPDPIRERVYVLRQDKNAVLVFDSTNYSQLTALRTGNTPVHMAITRDGRYLIVTNANSQIANVFDLETLEQTAPVEFNSGEYGRAIAVTSDNIFAVVLSEGPFVSEPPSTDPGQRSTGNLHRIDLNSRRSTPLFSLGIYTNSLPAGTALATSPSGSTMFIALPNGTVALYAEGPPRFIASRKDITSLSGAYAAMSDDLFFVGNHLLNRSLVPIGRLNGNNGIPVGITSFGEFGTRISSASASGLGTIDRFGLRGFDTVAPTSTIESPLIPASNPPIAQIGQTILPFTRHLALLPGNSGMVSLSPSGVMAIPSNFDAPVPVSDITSGIRRCE